MGICGYVNMGIWEYGKGGFQGGRQGTGIGPRTGYGQGKGGFQGGSDRDIEIEIEIEI